MHDLLIGLVNTWLQDVLGMNLTSKLEVDGRG